MSLASGRSLGQANVSLFTTWIKEREVEGDGQKYIHKGKLNRSEVAQKLGFGRSVFAQNPAIKTLALAFDV